MPGPEHEHEPRKKEQEPDTSVDDAEILDDLEADGESEHVQGGGLDGKGNDPYSYSHY